jgi:hypothetical protein
MTLVPNEVFHLLLSVVTGGVAAAWMVHDTVLIARLRGADRRNPLVRDKLFGYSMGIVIAMIGILGTLRFNGAL